MKILLAACLCVISGATYADDYDSGYNSGYYNSEKNL